VNSGKVRGGKKGGLKKASGSNKASLTAGVTKAIRGSGRTIRSGQSGDRGTA